MTVIKEFYAHRVIAMTASPTGILARYHRDVSDRLVDAARAGAPLRTGALRASIVRLHQDRGSHTVSGGAVARESYAELVEFGTGEFYSGGGRPPRYPFITSNRNFGHPPQMANGERAWMYGAAIGYRYTVAGQHAKHFMRDAFIEVSAASRYTLIAL